MNLNFKSYFKLLPKFLPRIVPKLLPIAAGAMRYSRAVAVRFALHETGALLCACAPLIHRAGETLQHLSDPVAPKRTGSSPYQQSSTQEEPSSFDF